MMQGNGSFFFFNDTATTEIYTLSLHDALPIFASLRPSRWSEPHPPKERVSQPAAPARRSAGSTAEGSGRSEEHTSELQSRQYLVCRLLLEKKKNNVADLAARAVPVGLVKHPSV